MNSEVQPIDVFEELVRLVSPQTIRIMAARALEAIAAGDDGVGLDNATDDAPATLEFTIRQDTISFWLGSSGLHYLPLNQALELLPPEPTTPPSPYS